MFEEAVGGGEHAFEALAVATLHLGRPLNRHDVAITAQGGDHHGEEALAVEFRLLTVVVDVVVDDDLLLGSLPGLAGAQDDAHETVAQSFTAPAHEFEAAALILHDHVEQDEGDVGVVLHHLARFGGGEDVAQFQRPAVELEALEQHGGHVVDIRLVVHHQNTPRLGRWFAHQTELRFSSHLRCPQEVGSRCPRATESMLRTVAP